MTALWPRLPLSESARLFALLREDDRLRPAVAHAAQTFGPVGTRVRPVDITRLQDRLRHLADDLGFPDASLVGERGIEFDRRAAAILREEMDITWSEASAREMWSFLALVVLPDLTDFRWAHRLPERNEERWIGRDLTRHTWSRLWWQATAFEGRPDLLDRLLESELNQLVERRSIGGHPALLVAVVEAFLRAVDDGAPRRSLLRDATKRLLRRLSYLDDVALTDDELAVLAGSVVAESRAILQG